jgi:hypothetical protein
MILALKTAYPDYTPSFPPLESEDIPAELEDEVILSPELLDRPLG